MSDLYFHFQVLKIKFIDDCLDVLQTDFINDNNLVSKEGINTYLDILTQEANIEIENKDLQIHAVNSKENLIYLKDQHCIMSFDINELFNILSNLDLEDDEDSPKGIEKFWAELPNMQIVYEFEDTENDI